MRQWQTLANDLRPFRHAEEGKDKAGKQHIWQKEHHRHLHGLKLVLRERRERVAKRQVGRDKQSRKRNKQGKIADQRHSKHYHPSSNDQRGLEETDQYIRSDLTQHDL